MKSPSTLELILVAVKVAGTPDLPNAPFSRDTALRVITELLEAARQAGFKQMDICLSALAGGHAETSARLLAAACDLITQDAAVAALGRAGLRVQRVH